MISVCDVSYSASLQKILDDVSATFDAGKVSAILGPNGAGKSTLLKCITGSLKPDFGTIWLEDRKLDSYSLAELSVKRAVLSQNTAVSFPFSVMEIVLMGRNPYTLNGNTASDIEIAEETLDMMDAWHLRDRSFPTLSGGEQQRVQFARVLSQIWDQREAYLFLDEPTSALDLKHQYQLMELVRNQCDERALTVIIVMHDLNIAYHNTDKSYFIQNGIVKVCGASKEVISADTLSEIYNLPPHYAASHINFSA
ncbi:MAG: heme ABC transporter ATP-binding protein [Proteobacteria bacterium]|nr:heme ABC transporter ATP-binding protein [Pseudomonadota bacterium]